MEKYDFLESILKETAPTPSYVFDLDLLFEHVEKVKTVLQESQSMLCHESKSISYRSYAGACRFV